MSDRDRQFLDYYERARVDDQLGYYDHRARWHGKRDDAMIVLTGLLMFVASVSSAVVLAKWEWLGPANLWIVLATLVPALSAAVAATRALYEHERNRERFANTRLDLQYLQAFKAPSADLSGPGYRAALESYVNEVEGLLSREHRQWVQSMSQVQLAETPEPTSIDEDG